MNNHSKKMIAPIIITIIVVLYFAGLAATLFFLGSIAIEWVLLGGILLILAAVMIGVCIQRMKEIRSGEEDDLSEY